MREYECKSERENSVEMSREWGSGAEICLKMCGRKQGRRCCQEEEEEEAREETEAKGERRSSNKAHYDCQARRCGSRKLRTNNSAARYLWNCTAEFGVLVAEDRQKDRKRRRGQRQRNQRNSPPFATNDLYFRRHRPMKRGVDYTPRRYY